MSYKVPRMAKTLVNGVPKSYGETIEEKVERVVNNGEPIEDDIRTDRWEVATDAMDAVQKSTKAQREKKGITKEDIVGNEVNSEDKGKGVAEG
jgi:heterodisulfide reductase subunit C